MALLLVVAPYAVSRLRSGERRVRVFSPDPTPAVGDVSTVRVLVYNIAHGRGTAESNWPGTAAEKERRVQSIARLIADAEADVVVLNEVDFDSTWSGGRNQAEAIARAAGYPHRVEQRNFDCRLLYGSWKFGNAVLSRYPIEGAELVRFAALSGWEEALAGSKQGLVCRLRLSDSQRVRLLAVHLEPRSELVRLASAEAMLQLAASSELPVIAAGDFNSSPRLFAAAGRNASRGSPSGGSAIDALDRSGRFRRPELDGSAAQKTFSSTQPMRAIDWILAPPRWRFSEYRVIPSLLSDHRPVLATLQMAPHDAQHSHGSEKADP